MTVDVAGVIPRVSRVSEEGPGTDLGEERDVRLAWGLLLAGVIGLAAAGVLIIERLRLAQDAAYVPSCSLNPILSCGSVMESSQASVLGFPNPIIGLAAFPVLVTTGVALLAGARLARWYWLGLQVGATAGLAFVVWLISQSLYRINALCPYCMVVWAVVVPVALYVTVRNAETGVLGAVVAGSRAVGAARAWLPTALLVLLIVLMAMIGIRFWSYWSTLL